MNARELLENADVVLSDLDGTLVDSSGAVGRAWGAFAVRNGLDPEAVVTFAQGRPSSETVARLTPNRHAVESRLVETAEVEDTRGVIALPGALELLTGDLRVAIVTSCSRALARVRLAAAGLPEPAVLVTSDDVAAGKPDPEPFRLGAQRMGVTPERCVVLEDAPAGITAGRLAGAKVIAVRTTHADGELSDADVIIDDLGGLDQPSL